MRKLVILPVLLLQFACQDVESKSIYTQAMEAEYTVQITGDTALVSASLSLSDETPKTFVELSGNDSLSALIGDTSHTLVHEGQLIQHAYSQSIDLEGATDISIAFYREHGEDAIDSSIVIPPEFQLDSPVKNQLVPIGDELEVLWSDTGAEGVLGLWVSGDCFMDYDREINTLQGNHIIQTSELTFFDGDNSACNAELTIEYRSSGTLDPMFSGGSYTATRVQQTNIIFVPSESVPSEESGSDEPNG